jgi:hypothetical protein
VQIDFFREHLGAGSAQLDGAQAVANDGK